MKRLLSLAATVCLIGCSAPVKIVKFDTIPSAPFKGDSVLLVWEIENADEASLNGRPVSKDTGSMQVLLEKSETFILKAIGANSEATNKLDIVAQPK